MVIILLADGFEEVEALTQVDFLRRAGMTVQTVGVQGRRVTGSHGIPVEADAELGSFELPRAAEMVVLPGGKAGVALMAENRAVHELLRAASQRRLWLAAICAAPTVLAADGYLAGLDATCYPGFETRFPPDVHYTGGAVEVSDGRRIITGRSVGVSGRFALAIVHALRGAEAADRLKATLHADW